MSSLLYGSLTQRRLNAAPETVLAATAVTAAGGTDGAKDTIKTWQDAMAALVPAEVLALHAVAMSYGTTTKGAGASAVTSITHPSQMAVVYVALMVLAYVLYLTGARTARRGQWLRALVPVAAFVLWTMIQPSTAFDALGIDMTSFARTMSAIIGAVVLGGVADALAKRALKAPSNS